MPTLQFKIKKPGGHRPKAEPPFFILEQDNWDDFGFRTLYHLYYCQKDRAGKIDETMIGPVKILRRGQTDADGIKVQEDFDALSDEFYSLGQSLDYYERLNQLGSSLRSKVLKALRDVIHTPKLVDMFRDESGWSISLTRGQKDYGARFMELARSLITGDYTTLASTDVELSFSVEGWNDEVQFHFKAPRVPAGPRFQGGILPESIAVLVGRNGSGKSTLLARLARVAFGTPTERLESPLKELGELKPEGIGFPRIITISFSPFDSFRLPGTDPRDRRQVIKDLGRGEGRFIFIGLRDILAEAAASQPKAGVSSRRKGSADDHLDRTQLKPIERLADEFQSALKKINSQDRKTLLEKVWNELFKEPSFGGLNWSDVVGSSIGEAKRFFLSCSTGHKIVLLTTSSMVASIEMRSLVLIDEPETHLHPPLLAAFMRSMRMVLREYEALAIVATHSPVVVQESLADHVRLVRREANTVSISPVRAETFGESIGQITSEVFGLQSDATDFHSVLDTLVERVRNLDEIEDLFMSGAMSQQARAYVMSLLPPSDKKK